MCCQEATLIAQQVIARGCLELASSLNLDFTEFSIFFVLLCIKTFNLFNTELVSYRIS